MLRSCADNERKNKETQRYYSKIPRTKQPKVFILADGSKFETKLDPIEYLFKYGVETPRGRIVAHQRDTKGADPLTLALCDWIDEGIAAGGLKLSEIFDERVDEEELF